MITFSSESLLATTVLDSLEPTELGKGKLHGGSVEETKEERDEV